MPRGAKNGASSSRRRAPAATIEEREDQLIALAVEVAEEQLRSRTASSQVITHFLKLASTKDRLEQEKLKKENELLTAKTDALQSSKHVEELYKQALNAMRSYSGGGDSSDED